MSSSEAAVGQAHLHHDGPLSPSSRHEGDGEEDARADPRCNLIVNYLPPTMTEDELRRLFERYGTVLMVKIVRDKLTGASLGYGFVRMDNPDMAYNAIAALNGFQIQSKKLKVSTARPQSKEITRSNIYISGLPPSWSKSELEKLFGEYGRVIECRVLYDVQLDPTSKQSRGVGFCRMDNNQNALAAISALNNTVPHGGATKLNLKLADPPRDSKTRSPAVGYMGHGVLPGYQSSYLPYPYQQAFGGGMSALALSSINHAGPGPQGSMMGGGMGGMMGGGMGIVGGFDGGKKSYPGVCLFIYHLNPECNEENLRSLFSNYGTVLSAKVMKDLHTGRSKGFGFVNMVSEQEARAAIAQLDGFQLGGKYLKVSLKK